MKERNPVVWEELKDELAIVRYTDHVPFRFPGQGLDPRREKGTPASIGSSLVSAVDLNSRYIKYIINIAYRLSKLNFLPESAQHVFIIGMFIR